MNIETVQPLKGHADRNKLVFDTTRSFYFIARISLITYMVRL